MLEINHLRRLARISAFYLLPPVFHLASRPSRLRVKQPNFFPFSDAGNQPLTIYPTQSDFFRLFPTLWLEINHLCRKPAHDPRTSQDATAGATFSLGTSGQRLRKTSPHYPAKLMPKILK
jgi:hypothetical protein